MYSTSQDIHVYVYEYLMMKLTVNLLQEEDAEDSDEAKVEPLTAAGKEPRQDRLLYNWQYWLGGNEMVEQLTILYKFKYTS